jgi:hypothetical protein
MISLKSLFSIAVFVLPLLGAATAPSMSWAQTAKAASDSATDAGPKRPTHESSGIRVAINSMKIHGPYIEIQFAIQNITKMRQYLIVYGPRDIATDSGSSGNSTNITGIEHCPFYQQNSDGLKNCRDNVAKDINNFTYIEPGEFTTLNLQYQFTDQNYRYSNTVSFSLLMLARAASGDVDALSAAEAAKTIGAARVININFPLMPLKEE